MSWCFWDLKTLLITLSLIATFGFNFPIYIATMSVTVFHGNAGQYRLLTSALAIGSVTDALLAAKRQQPRLRLPCVATLGFGLFCRLAAIAPDESAVRCSAHAYRPGGADLQHLDEWS